MLVYGLVALVLRARGSSSAWAWTLMLGFTIVSIGANAAHAYDVGPELRTIVGVVLVALAPPVGADVDSRAGVPRSRPHARRRIGACPGR